MAVSETKCCHDRAPVLVARLRLILTAALTLGACLTDAASAQRSGVDSAVQPASSRGPVTQQPISIPSAALKARFEQRPTQVGDRVLQSLQVQMDLSTRIVQSGQTAHEGVSSLRREQRRQVDVTQVVDGKLRQARVRFVAARSRGAEAKQDEPLSSQPIEGKEYIVERAGEQLLVTDLQGDIPPLEEYKLVVDALQSLGRPNPLATYLVGREISVGQSLKVPREVASKLLNLTPDMGEVRLFELTLQRVSRLPDKTDGQVAEFLAKINTVARTGSQLTTTIAGRVVIEVDTCRTLEARLTGPVNLSAVERTPLGIYQYIANGGVRVAVESEYSVSDAL